MAQVFSYDSNARRESLLDIITNISPTENYLLSNLAKSKSSNTQHEWVTDTLKTPATNAQIEGSDASFANRTNPGRVTNWTQIVRVDFQVSDSERARNYPQFADRYRYEMSKAMKEWSNDAEFNLVRSTQATGLGSGTARSMVGLKSAISTVATTLSAVSLSENHLNAYLQNAWSQGGKVDTVLVGATLKRRISGFTANGTKQFQQQEKELVNVVDMYISDFGPVKVILHRYVTIAGTDAGQDIVGIQADKFRVAYFREPEHVALAKSGSSTKGMIEGELTLEYLAENSSFKAINHA
mgnify:FL=1